MEIVKIKCPVCGKEEFVLIDPPYHCGMETYIEEYTKYYACLNCGLVLRFAKGLVDNLLFNAFLETEDGQKYVSEKNKLDKINEQIVLLEKRECDLRKELEDDIRSIRRDNEIKVELKELEKSIKDLRKDAEACKKEVDRLKK